MSDERFGYDSFAFRIAHRTSHIASSPSLATRMDHLLEPIFLARILVCAFFAVLFLHSGLDKVFDWAGNMGWLGPHFAKSPVKGMVPLLLGIITATEVSAGVTCTFAVFVLFLGGPAWIPVVGVGLASLNLVMLFAGQRIAKDYAGAAVLAAYFAVAILGLMLMQAL